MVVASLLYAVCLYRAYGALDTLSPYIYYELLLLLVTDESCDVCIGIVCSMLVLMIMFTDTVCRFTVFLLVELLCPLIVVFTI